VGRFVTQDSMKGNISVPLSFNRYVYARDDPEKYNDPTGHASMHIQMDWGGSSNTDITVQTYKVDGNTVIVTKETGTDGYVTLYSTTVSEGGEPVSTTVAASPIMVTKPQSPSQSTCYAEIGHGAELIASGYGIFDIFDSIAVYYGVEVSGTIATVSILGFAFGAPIAIALIGLYVTYYNVQC
jgi:hypothetical protein